MELKINESKFKKLLFNYLDNQTEFKRAQEHRTGYGSNVREFFIESNYGDEDAPDYDWLFTYYKSPEDYEDIRKELELFSPLLKYVFEQECEHTIFSLFAPIEVSNNFLHTGHSFSINLYFLGTLYFGISTS